MFLLIGIGTGALSGLLGVGGGIVMVPALVGLGYSRHFANATSLAAILLVALAGTVAFGQGGSLDWGVGIALGIGGLVGSTIGAKLMKRLSGPALGLIFGGVLLLAGLRMALGGDVAATNLIASPPLRIAAEVLIGAAAGVASGLAGIGGGTVLVPAMVFLLGIDQHTAEGTSLLAILFTAAAATRVNVANRFVDWRAMWILGILGAATAPLAAAFALQIPATNLTRIFGVFAIAVAIQAIVKNWRSPPAAPA